MGIVASAGLWIYAEMFGLIHSIALVNRISLSTQMIAFMAAWRADSKTKGG